MLNPFPYLLSFGAFVPLALRLAMALFLFLAARHLWNNRANIVSELFTMVGRLAWPKFYVLLALQVLAAISLLVGFYTQIGAIAGIIVFLVPALYARRLPNLLPWTGALPLLLALIAATLLVSGAGIYAFDYPF